MLQFVGWLIVSRKILRASWPLLAFLVVSFWLFRSTVLDLIGTPLIFPLAFLGTLIWFGIKVINRLKE